MEIEVREQTGENATGKSYNVSLSLDDLSPLKQQAQINEQDHREQNPTIR